MAATRKNKEEQYHALINKHQQYLKMQEDYRQTNWRLKKQTEKMQILNEIVYSAEHQQKIDDAITKYHQLETLQQDYQQILKEQNVRPQQIQAVKVQNEKLRDQVSRLNFQAAQLSVKNATFEEKYGILQRYADQYEKRFMKYQAQIQELEKKQPQEDSLWRRLGIQKIEKVLASADKESQMTNQQQINLAKSGFFSKLSYEKVKEVQELSQKMKNNQTILKQKQILNQQLKIQNNIVSRMFGFDSFEQANDNEQNLRAEDEQLDKQIMRLREEIYHGQQQQLHLRQNLSEIAKKSAVQKTQDYLKQKGGEVKNKLNIVQQTLSLVLMDESQSAKEQAQTIIKQITAMKQELLKLEHGIYNGQIDVPG